MLGRTNTGGGGVGGVLTVTAPAGVTASVSKDGKIKTKTANAEGKAVFKGLATGTWTLTITDGSQTSTKPVEITADYSTAIAFFAATISIVYPAGSVCTCSDGVTTLTAPDTSGTWVCVVPNAGTWTARRSDGLSVSVAITTDGQSVDVSLTEAYLYNSGDQCTNITGGWTIKKAGASTTALASDGITLGYNGEAGSEAIIYTNNQITFPYQGTKKLKVLVDVSGYVNATNAPCSFGLSASPKLSSAPNLIGYAMHTSFNKTGTMLEYELIISSATGNYHVVFNAICRGKIHKIWLE